MRSLHPAVPAALVLVGALAACSDSTSTAPAPRPQISGAIAAANPLNALSAIVRATVADADSVRVRAWAEGADTVIATPFRASSGPDSLAVLGLAPGASYRLVLDAVHGRDTVTSDTMAFTAGALPAFLRSIALDFTGPGRPAGYLLTVAGDGKTSFAVAFDGTGAIRWYRQFDGDFVEETKQQFNGDFTTFVGATHGAEPVPGRYDEYHSDGGLVRTFAVPEPAYVDNHELLLVGDSAAPDALFFTYTRRHLDLSASGGPADTLVVGHQLVRMNAAGDVQTIFDAWDHFDPSENVEPNGARDFDHPNALAIDANGDYIVSWRHLAQITAIDHTNGQLLWRLGGRNDDIAVVGDPLGFFSAQHSVRVLPNGNLLLFDNGTRHQPSESRAVEYAIDPAAKKATFVWQFRHAPRIFTGFTGSVQRLTNGNTIVGWTWGTPVRATEVTAADAVVWDAIMRVPSTNAQSAYRVIEVPSLYEYRAP